ncbi:MAG TPA: prepilin-type N-terminal cleavage/methylation domain-containing protein [Pyrinomonadaceae bacterium]|jgi:Tfp pilus assembly protein PilV
MNCSREISRPEEEGGPRAAAKRRRGRAERGFTLAETAVAFLIMMIVLLGVASVFAYAVYNNTSGADRTQSLALAQQSLETLRSYQYSSAAEDPRLKKGAYTQSARYGGSNRLYTIDWTIDDTTNSVKTITVKVTPVGAGPSWGSGAAAGVTIITQRAKSD